MSTPLPSTRHNRALSTSTSYRRKAVIALSRGGNVVTVEPTSAQFVSDSRRNMRWSGSLTVVQSELAPMLPRDLLAPFGTLVDVSIGVELLDGSTSYVPYGRYSISSTKVTISQTNKVTDISLIDLSDTIERYRFEYPITVASGTDLAQMINIIVTDRTGVNPRLSNVGRSLGADRVFGLDPQTGPWSEIVDVLEGFGLTCWYNRVGQIEISAPNPSNVTIQTLPGLTSMAADFDTRPYNVIVVRGEPPELPPVQAVAYDNDPASSTYAGESAGSSPYGRVTRYYASPLITTEAQAINTATQFLIESIGAGATWTAVRGFDPTIDPFDVYSIQNQPVVVDAITLDMFGNTTMAVRSL